MRKEKESIKEPYTYLESWIKAYKEQTLRFGKEEVSLHDIKIIILANIAKAPKQFKCKKEELFADCMNHVVDEVVKGFNKNKKAKDKNYNIKGYIKHSVIRYLMRLGKTNHCVQIGNRNGTKGKDISYSYFLDLKPSINSE